jgi:hypothetical protein
MINQAKSPVKNIFADAISLRKKILELFRYSVNVTFTAVSCTKSFAGVKNPKIFCIGRNKTGTTSLQHALAGFGYRVGDQRSAELLMENWGVRDFRKLIRYCHTADAFQDVPFSYHYTFQAMDAAFPGSKFILSVRDSDEQWYQSVVRFQSMRLERRIGVRRIPTIIDIKSDPYVKLGWGWRNRELLGNDLHEPYSIQDKRELIDYYNRHNYLVKDYFRHRPEDLLVINLAEADAMQRLCRFLGKQYKGQTMPKLNQSK